MSFYESPLFVDLLLWTVYVLLTLAVGLMLWSMLRHPRQLVRGGSAAAWVAFGLFVATLVVGCLLADDSPILINGKPYCDAFWLRMTDTLIISSLVLIVLAVVGVVLGMSGIGRKLSLKRRKDV